MIVLPVPAFAGVRRLLSQPENNMGILGCIQQECGRLI